MKTLLCLLPHPPSFEGSFGMLTQLHQRGKVAVELLVAKRMVEMDPRIGQAIDEAGLPHRYVSQIGMELFSLPKVLRADALLLHTDPVAYFKKSRLRDRLIPRFEVPTVFIQHGMCQYGFTYTLDDIKREYYAQKLLWWADLPADLPDIITNEVRSRSSVVGFQKQIDQRPYAREKALKTLLNPWKKRVLICHNFPWAGQRSPEIHERARAYLTELVKRNPDTMFIFRSHRGRSGKVADIGAVLEDQFPNALLSDRHNGAFKHATGPDVLAHVDCVITHPSTIILDAAYAGIPVAVLDFIDEPLGKCTDNYAHLPQVKDIESATAFVAGHTWDDSMYQKLFDLYGPSIEENTIKAAEAIEDFMLG